MNGILLMILAAIGGIIYVVILGALYGLIYRISKVKTIRIIIVAIIQWIAFYIYYINYEPYKNPYIAALFCALIGTALIIWLEADNKNQNRQVMQ